MQSIFSQLLARGAIFCRRSVAFMGLVVVSLVFFPSCAKVRAKTDSPAAVTVGVTKVTRKSLQRQITLSSELVPFQEIDVYAKESGFVKKLYVDYGSRVQAGQLMATLEIPELEAQIAGGSIRHQERVGRSFPRRAPIETLSGAVSRSSTSNIRACSSSATR